MVTYSIPRQNCASLWDQDLQHLRPELWAVEAWILGDIGSSKCSNSCLTAWFPEPLFFFFFPHVVDLLGAQRHRKDFESQSIQHCREEYLILRVLSSCWLFSYVVHRLFYHPIHFCAASVWYSTWCKGACVHGPFLGPSFAVNWVPGLFNVLWNSGTLLLWKLLWNSIDWALPQ